MRQFWKIGACGQYGGYFDQTPADTINNCGNIEICYKICRDAGTSSCQAWTYDLTDRSCKLYKSRSNYKIVDYNSKKVISGPNQCLQGSWENTKSNKILFARITMNSEMSVNSREDSREVME